MVKTVELPLEVNVHANVYRAAVQPQSIPVKFTVLKERNNNPDVCHTSDGRGAIVGVARAVRSWRSLRRDFPVAWPT